MNPETLHPMLKESIHRFLTQYYNGNTDFSSLTAITSRFLHTLPNLPLEFIWFYTALSFHSSTLPPNHISRPTSLFHLLVSNTSPHTTPQRIAALAPLISELCNLLLIDPNNELTNLLEGIVSYISITSRGPHRGCDDDCDSLNLCFGELVRVWVVERVGGQNCKFGEELRAFVPLVSDRVRAGIGKEGCGVGYLAGVVMVEAFLLSLCLRVRSAGVSGRKVLEDELCDSVVRMITAFQSYYFVDILLSMLLEPVLPVISLVNCGDELFLRGVLFAAVTSVEYSFLSPQKGSQPSCDLKNIAVTWLFVADNAKRFARENDDQNKVISYEQAFLESCLTSQLIKWVANHPIMQSVTSIPKFTSPIALIKWLLTVEDQGVNVFDSDLSKIYAKAIICRSRTECEPVLYNSDSGHLNGNHFGYPTSKAKVADKVDGDLEMVDSMDSGFLDASVLVKLTATNGTRKRKEARKDEEHKQVKFVKCHLNENTVRENVLPLGAEDDVSGGIEVDNAVCVGELEYMEQ